MIVGVARSLIMVAMFDVGVALSGTAAAGITCFVVVHFFVLFYLEKDSSNPINNSVFEKPPSNNEVVGREVETTRVLGSCVWCCLGVWFLGCDGRLPAVGCFC